MAGVDGWRHRSAPQPDRGSRGACGVTPSYGRCRARRAQRARAAIGRTRDGCWRQAEVTASPTVAAPTVTSQNAVIQLAPTRPSTRPPASTTAPTLPSAMRAPLHTCLRAPVHLRDWEQRRRLLDGNGGARTWRRESDRCGA